MTMQQGTYAIICKPNGWIYIGSSKTVPRRAESHFQSLRRGDHANAGLQHDFNQFGQDAFRFESVDRVDDPLLLKAAEIDLMAQLIAHVPLYNITQMGPILQRKRDELKSDPTALDRLLSLSRRCREEQLLKRNRIRYGVEPSDESDYSASESVVRGIIKVWAERYGKEMILRALSEAAPGPDDQSS